MVIANAAVSVRLDTFGNLIRRNKSRPKSTTSAKLSQGSDGEPIRFQYWQNAPEEVLKKA